MWISPFFSLRWEDEKNQPQTGHICSFKDWVIDPRFTWMIALGCPGIYKKKIEKTGVISPTLTNCGVFEVFCIWVQSSNDPNIDPKFPREHRRLGGLSLGSQLLRRCSLWRPRRLEWYMKITIDWKRLYNSYDYIICCIDKYMFIHIYTRLYVNIERNTYD